MSEHAAKTIRTVLFDLDGTLADTAPDLAFALNQVRRARGHAPLPFERIRPVVSHGARALITLGFQLTPEHPDFEPLRQDLLAAYRAHLVRETRLFPGMDGVLAGIEARGLNWGVVTNKPAALTDPLLRELGVAARAACIVSGDTLPQRKPHPAPMLYACRCAGSTPSQCVYVGDAQRDIEAGRAAGMHTVAALFGYIEGPQDPLGWGADALIDAPTDLLAWLDARLAPDRAIEAGGSA